MRRVAVIGSTGQFGSDLVAVLQAEGYNTIPLSHADVECADPDSVSKALSGINPHIVVNCAGFVRVDDCEDLFREAYLVNALGALNVAMACARLNALCVYVSTDYVFDGMKGQPYTEGDAPYPVNAYGASKLAGENLVRQACARWLIVRMASLFGKAGARGKSGNFVETIIARAQSGKPLQVVSDIRMSPTYAWDVARALERLIRQNATGLFHLTNDGACSWYEFAREALALAGLDVPVEPVSSEEFASRAPRPRDSSLKSTRLNSVVKECLPPWPKALQAYLEQKGYRNGMSLALGCGLAGLNGEQVSRKTD